MKPLQDYIVERHGLAFDDPLHRVVYVAVATLWAGLTTMVVISTLLLTTFSDLALRPLGIFEGLIALLCMSFLVDFHLNRSRPRIVRATIGVAIIVLWTIFWFVGSRVMSICWLGAFPGLAIYLLGMRRGLIAVGVLLAGVALAVCCPHGSPLPPSNSSALADVISTLASISFLVVQLHFFESSRQAMHGAIQQQNHRLATLSVTDRLTGLYNRTKLDQVLEHEWTRSARYQHSLSVVLIDLDHFKHVNDQFGHAAGDDVLASLAAVLQRVGRDSDVLGRWGGEEFLIICPNTPLHGALAVAERARKLIESNSFPVVGHKTASLGVSTYRPGDDIRSLLIRADEALYRAKDGGRNQIRSEPTVDRAWTVIEGDAA
jgi:diguanylate cyclase (GGDEF)-like protein